MKSKDHLQKHDRIQQEIFVYLWNRYPEMRYTMWHTPNEFKQDFKFILEYFFSFVKNKVEVDKLESKLKHRAMLAAVRRKNIGVLSGVTDLVFYRKGVLYIFDVKVGKDTLSDSQKEFIKAIVKQGGQFYEINSVEEGISIIERIMSA